MDRIGASAGKRKCHTTENFGGHNKVAIPRVPPASQPPARRRVERACEGCRERKIKCEGQKPACAQCATSGVDCVYPPSRREKQEEQVEQLKSENEQYKSLLVKLTGLMGSIENEISQTLGVCTCFSW